MCIEVLVINDWQCWSWNDEFVLCIEMSVKD